MQRIYALIKGLDDAMKDIVDELKRQDVYDNTMIIITADNGMFHGEHGLSGKWYPYQESIRVPLIIRDPRMPKEKIGTTDESLTLNVDLAETILGAAGLQPHPTMQGRDISDLYLSKQYEAEEWRNDFLYEFDLGGTDIERSSALVSKKYKYVRLNDAIFESIPDENIIEELFDLDADPLELDNLLKQNIDKKFPNEDIIGEMRKRMKSLKDKIRSPSLDNVECEVSEI